MARLRNLEWVRFTYGGDTWRVILTTPALAPSYCEEIRNGSALAICHYEATTIYIDAGFPEDELAETLHHEFHHVKGRDHGNEAHRFFADSSPVVVSIYRAIGIDLTPPLPAGWERLQRSSKRWHARKEWA